MNRWHVYEHIKQTYMFSGRVPTRQEVFSQFRGTLRFEIEEGIAEFELMAKEVLPSEKVKSA